MIGSLRGSVLEWSAAGEVLVEVGGVGYRVLVPLSSLAVLEPGGVAVLFTHLHARDDTLVLYGFCTREERDTFETLISSTGVGPKLGLAALSVYSPGALRRAVAADDVDALMLVPGVGRRTAARLCVELKERLEVPAAIGGDGGDGRDGESSARAQVRQALVGLGYSPEEVRAALVALPPSDSMDDSAEGSVEELLRAALRRRGAARDPGPVALEART